jgi:ketosteroid isomerase-like protein
MKKIFWLVVLGVVFYAGFSVANGKGNEDSQMEMAMKMTTEQGESKERVEKLIRDHARAWETGDMELFLSTIHEDIVFAYPGRRLNHKDLVEDFKYYNDNFTNTKVYINNIITEGDMVAVEWQFASNNPDDKRTSVSDGIIGKIKDGRIISWKEYLDGRVSRMQVVDELLLEEGEEPFPWPLKPAKNQ